MRQDVCSKAHLNTPFKNVVNTYILPDPFQGSFSSIKEKTHWINGKFQNRNRVSELGCNSSLLHGFYNMCQHGFNNMWQLGFRLKPDCEECKTWRIPWWSLDASSDQRHNLSDHGPRSAENDLGFVWTPPPRIPNKLLINRSITIKLPVNSILFPKVFIFNVYAT